MKKVVAALIVLVVVTAGAALVVKRKRALSSLAPPTVVAIPVLVAAVREGAVAEGIRTVALVQADISTTISAQAAGSVVAVLRREGDRVAKGERLARIDPRTFDDAVEVARARLAAAAEELSRQEAVSRRDRALFEGRAISRQALDASQAQLESARAAEVASRRGLETARTARGYAEVAAPYAGVVTARMVEPGDLATPGKPLFVLQVAGKVRLLSKLSQSSVAGIAPGAGVTFASGARTLSARVTRVYPALDASRLGSVETEMATAPFGLPPGAVVAATYDFRPTNGLVIPALALLEGLEETLVVRVKEGRAEPVPVVVATRGSGQAVVTGSLVPGDVIVVGLPSELMALTAGTPVRAATFAASAIAEGGRP